MKNFFTIAQAAEELEITVDEVKRLLRERGTSMTLTAVGPTLTAAAVRSLGEKRERSFARYSMRSFTKV